METIASYAPAIITAVGVIAAIVSVITEMTKDIGFLKKIPTILQVIILSVVLWIIAYLAACGAGYATFTWYFLVSAIVAGFITAYVSSYGWEKLNDVFLRYQKKKEDKK
jgi:hypothetical protein